MKYFFIIIILVTNDTHTERTNAHSTFRLWQCFTLVVPEVASWCRPLPVFNLLATDLLYWSVGFILID